MIKIGKNLSEWSVYSCQPKKTYELKKIIKDRISKEGYNCDLNDIDVSLITDMSYLFYYLDFRGDISEWNVSNVEDMSRMFFGTNFNQDISKWNVRNVKDMTRMFQYSTFDQDISKWNIRKECDTAYMFLKCTIKEEYKPKLSNDQDWKESFEVLDLFLHPKEQV